MSGVSSRSRSPDCSAASGCWDISIRWMCRCSRPGWRSAPGTVRKAVSSTSCASSVPASAAGAPVRRSHICQGVRFMIASTKTRTDVEVAAVRLVRAAHGIGEGIVPGALVLDGVALGKAGGERLDQGALRRGDAVGEGQGGLGGVIGAGQGAGLGIGVPHLPRKIVVGADGVGDAPMSHGAVRIGCQRGFEAMDGLLVVEAEAPVQAAIEPKLRGRGCGGDFAACRAEIVGVVVHVASSAFCRASGG